MATDRLQIVELGLITFLVFGPAGAGLAQQLDSKVEEKVEYKEVRGEVTGLSKDAISVEYSKTKESSYEMLIPVNNRTRLEHIKSLTEIKIGDTVRVKYEQTYKEGKDKERLVLKTIATVITFVRHKISEGSLISKEKQQEE